MILTQNGITRVLDDPVEIARFKRLGYKEAESVSELPAPSGSLRPDFVAKAHAAQAKAEAKATKKAGAK